jgi:hypothetical protein
MSSFFTKSLPQHKRGSSTACCCIVSLRQNHGWQHRGGEILNGWEEKWPHAGVRARNTATVTGASGRPRLIMISAMNAIRRWPRTARRKMNRTLRQPTPQPAKSSGSKTQTRISNGILRHFFPFFGARAGVRIPPLRKAPLNSPVVLDDKAALAAVLCSA